MREDSLNGKKMDMKSILESSYLNYIIRLIMGIVFIYASYSKILDPVSFSSNIHNFGVTPLYIENLIAIVLPWLELFIGLGLITGIKYHASIDISIYLMWAFTFLILQAYLRGKSIDCGCFMTDISASDAAEKRFDMLKRIFEDIVFLIMLYKLKYDANNKKTH